MIVCHFPLVLHGMQYAEALIDVDGHIHSDRNDVFEFMKTRERALNAGCMINNYEPVQ